MPSQLHESLVELFRNKPVLAPRLLQETLRLDLPDYTEVKTDSADFTDIQPAEYRADLVIKLFVNGEPVLGIIVETQLRRSAAKLFSWPVYAVNLRARMRCPVCVLVVTPRKTVEVWARRPIHLGGESRFQPCVLPWSAIPEITDEKKALDNPELTVLSAVAHARDRDTNKAARIAVVAHKTCISLDEMRSNLYLDLVIKSLPNPVAHRVLELMAISNCKYQSEFARRYYGEGQKKGKAEGKMEGMAEGRAEGMARGMARGMVKGRVEGYRQVVLDLLNLRFGALAATEVERLQRCNAKSLGRIAKRLVTAKTLSQALGAARNHHATAARVYRH